jgi:hypothetical protein
VHHPRKLQIFALLALGLAGCGTSTSGSSGSTYAGTTSQGLPISFAVTPRSIESIQFGWQATCADGRMHTNTIALGSASIRSGAFATSATLNTGASSAASGTLLGDSATGYVSRAGPSAFGTDCTDIGVTWHAHRVG